MKNLSKRTRLTLLISLFFVTTTQVVTPIHGMGVLSGAYSAYKANKLKNDFLRAVSCAIKPWTCKAGRITLMAATFALLLYIMNARRTKEGRTFESSSAMPMGAWTPEGAIFAVAGIEPVTRAHIIAMAQQVGGDSNRQNELGEYLWLNPQKLANKEAALSAGIFFVRAYNSTTPAAFANYWKKATAPPEFKYGIYGALGALREAQ